MNFLEFCNADNKAEMGYGQKRGYWNYQQPKRQKTYKKNKVIKVYKKSELKYFECAYSNAVDNGTDWSGTNSDANIPSSFGCLFCPVQGLDITNRVGRSVQVYSIKIRGLLEPTDADGLVGIQGAPSVRLILLRDKETRSTAFVDTDVMQAPLTPSIPLVNETFRNLASLGRYKVYKDKTFRVISQSGAATSASQGTAPQIPFQMKVRFKKPLTVNFTNANTGTFADIVDNSFHLLAHSSNDDWAVAMTYTCRVGFRDP